MTTLQPGNKGSQEDVGIEQFFLLTFLKMQLLSAKCCFQICTISNWQGSGVMLESPETVGWTPGYKKQITRWSLPLVQSRHHPEPSQAYKTHVPGSWSQLPQEHTHMSAVSPMSAVSLTAGVAWGWASLPLDVLQVTKSLVSLRILIIKLVMVFHLHR